MINSSNPGYTHHVVILCTENTNDHELHFLTQIKYFPLGSLLAAIEETSAFGGVYPCAAFRICGGPQQSTNL